MLFEFLTDYLSIIIFVFIALALSIGFIAINYAASPKIQIQKSYQLTSAGLVPSATRELSLMSGSI